MESMLEQQELNVEVRERNLSLLIPGAVRGMNYSPYLIEYLPRNLNSKIERIQKFINTLKSISEDKREFIMEEIQALNLTKYVGEIVKSIFSGKLTIKDQDLIIDVCLILHSKYEEFTPLVYPQLERQFQEASFQELNKKRNILRLLSELYLKGLIQEYKKVFHCLNCLIVRKEPNTLSEEDFLSGLMVVIDYLKTYGEIFFQILSK